MEIAAIGRRLELGEQLKIKYRYPEETNENSNTLFGVRSDRLVDVSVELGRLYTNFRGETPIWLQADEVLDISPDDGVYEDFQSA